MSIIIKEMDMPKEGTAVRIVILYNGQVFLDNGVGKPTYHAVKIPTPHGRIVDYDRIFKDCTDLTSAECNPRWYPPIVILEAED